jgi:hypothetical protein
MDIELRQTESKKEGRLEGTERIERERGREREREE